MPRPRTAYETHDRWEERQAYRRRDRWTVNCGWSNEQVRSLATRSEGAASRGGSGNVTSLERKSMSVVAFASRCVIAGRFHLRSIVARIEVWSWTVLVTAWRFA